VQALDIEGSLDRLAVMESGDGDLFVAGSGNGVLLLEGTSPLRLTQEQIFLARLDHTGRTRWVKSVAETQRGSPVKLLPFGDDMILSFHWQAYVRMGFDRKAPVTFQGRRRSSAIARLDKSGQLAWVSSIAAVIKAPIVNGQQIVVPFEIGNGTDNPKAIALHLRGAREGTRLGSLGRSDIALLQLDGGGSLTSVTQLGGPGDERLASIAAGNGGMYAAGQFSQEFLIVESSQRQLVLRSNTGADAWLAFLAGHDLPPSPSGQVKRLVEARALAHQAGRAQRARHLADSARHRSKAEAQAPLETK
jgi:hypothetical protein